MDEQDQEAKVQEEAEEMTEPSAAEEVVEGEVVEVEPKDDLQAALDKARAEAEDFLDQLRRARADYANYKRRAEQDRKDLLRYANAGLVTKLLPALDDFERAFQTVPSGLDRMTWVEGIALIHRKLEIVLQSEGLQAIEVAGKKFDPAEHEAISYEDRDDLEDGDIIAQVQKGYKFGDRILRPALVRVARHVPKPEAAPQAEEEKPEE